MNANLVYGGPQLSWQRKIHHRKIQFKTTNSNYSRQTTNTHGKNKNITAIHNSSRQEQNAHGKNKTLTAKAKHSRQKQNAHGKIKSRMVVSGCPSTWCQAPGGVEGIENKLRLQTSIDYAWSNKNFAVLLDVSYATTYIFRSERLLLLQKLKKIQK